MSAFIMIIMDIDRSQHNILAQALKQRAKASNVGIWLGNRYNQEIEQALLLDRPVSAPFSFSIADDDIYENCEDLLTPFWYFGCSEEIFESNMTKIQSILKECLLYTDNLDLFIGTSGDHYHDFVNLSITPDQFLSEMIRLFDEDRWSPPPSVHCILKRKI